MCSKMACNKLPETKIDLSHSKFLYLVIHISHPHFTFRKYLTIAKIIPFGYNHYTISLLSIFQLKTIYQSMYSMGTN